MGETYRPPVGPDNEVEEKEYIPPVGPGSKSLPPAGDYRDLPPGLLPDVQEIEEG